jgi:hypothetical protein
MPAHSLGTGTSRIIPIRCDDELRDQLRMHLRPGEDLSSLTRELWRKEVAARAIQAVFDAEPKKTSARKPRKSRGKT